MYVIILQNDVNTSLLYFQKKDHVLLVSLKCDALVILVTTQDVEHILMLDVKGISAAVAIQNGSTEIEKLIVVALELVRTIVQKKYVYIKHLIQCSAHCVGAYI